MTPFSDLCTCVKEQCDPATSRARVYVGLEHIDSASFNLTRHGTPAEVQSSKTVFHKGDILYGKLRPYLDKAVLAPCEGICSTDILVLRPNSETCGAYLLGLIHSAAFRTHADKTTNGVNHPRTSWPAIAQFESSVPKKPEQEKIAAVLWTIQRAIHVQHKLVAATRDLKQSTMRHLYTSGLRSETIKQTEIGPVPTTWAVQPLESYREFLQYGTSGKCDYHGKGNPVIRIPNVINGRIHAGDLKWCELTQSEVESLLLAHGDVVFIRTNGVRDRVGTCAVYEGRPENALFASYLIRARLKTKALNPYFLQYFTDTPAGLSQLGGRASPAADGKFNVNTKTIDSVLVPAPDPEEQKDIVRVLQTLDRKIALHDRKRAALSELFQTLLHELIMGQTSVRRLNIDTSEVATTTTE